MGDETALTDDDLAVIRESLNYSVRCVSDYQHIDYSHKRESLIPIEKARDKVRQIIAARKEANRGR